MVDYKVTTCLNSGASTPTGVNEAINLKQTLSHK